jgi:transposase, IS6 family
VHLDRGYNSGKTRTTLGRARLGRPHRPQGHARPSPGQQSGRRWNAPTPGATRSASSAGAASGAVGDRWQVDETYVKVAGRWRYVYRSIDQFGQVIDVFVSPRRDAAAAHRFFQRAIGTMGIAPVEVITDHAPVYQAALEELLPAAWHRTDRYANNHIEADHGRLKSRLHSMRGLKQDRSARIVIAGHRFVQNVRRGHYELAVDEPVARRLAVAFDELALAI